MKGLCKSKGGYTVKDMEGLASLNTCHTRKTNNNSFSFCPFYKECIALGWMVMFTTCTR